MKTDGALVLSIYRRLEKIFQNDGLYWLQYGLALRDFDMQSDALEKLRTAVEAYSSEQTEHALAQQFIILAMQSETRARAIPYLNDAIERLRNLRKVIPEEDTYPIVTMAEGHTKIIKKFDGDAAGQSIAKEYLREIEHLVKVLPQDERLAAARDRLFIYTTTGIFPPKAASDPY